jgi:hypothetical protein
MRAFSAQNPGIECRGGMVKKLSIALVTMAVALATTPAALATTFTFTFTANGVTATGTLTGNLFASGMFDIESGTINLVGGPITGSGVLDIDPNGPGGVYTYQNPPNSGGTNYTIDNILTPGSNPELDGNGILFTVDGTPIAIWGDGPNTYEIFEGDWLLDDYGDFVTPEPDSLFLLGTGLLGLAVIVFRKSKQSGLALHS